MLNPVALTNTVDHTMALHIDNLHYSIGGTEIIRGLSSDVNSTGVSVLMGPNGAGKSVLLRLLHGLITPDSGRIEWDGEPIGDAVRGKQAMVFQRPVLLRRSVAANLEFVARHCVPHGECDVSALLEVVGLGGKENTPARKLSGGEQQRLALARALVTEPEVLLLDEPSASLDPASTLIIEQVVKHRRDAGVKIYFVTHDVGQAHRIADEVLFIHHGQLIEQAVASEFFNRPASNQAIAYLNGDIIL